MLFKNPHDAQRFVMIQLARAMTCAKTANDTQQIAEAIFHARLLWRAPIEEYEKNPQGSCGAAQQDSREG